MKKSSFGFIKVCEHAGEKIEYLEFLKEGRFHQHKSTEHFTVLRGFGELLTETDSVKIEEGETYHIPPNTYHKMKPLSENLKILVSYSSREFIESL